MLRKQSRFTPDSPLTVVTAAYRCARYLTAAVESGLHCPAAKVLVVVDGGGDGATGRIARQLEQRFPGEVRVLEQERNVGISRNLNRAFAQVKTPFVLRCDGDDVVIPDYVDFALQQMIADPDLAMIAGSGVSIGPDEKLQYREESSTGVDAARLRVMSREDGFQFAAAWDPYPVSSCAIYRVDAVMRSGGFSEELPWNWAEDREIWFRLARRWRTAYYHGPGVFYREHPATTTTMNRRADVCCLGNHELLRQVEGLWPEPQYAGTLRQLRFRNAAECFRSAARFLRTGKPRGAWLRVAAGAADMRAALFRKRFSDAPCPAPRREEGRAT